MISYTNKSLEDVISWTPLEYIPAFIYE